MNSRRLAQRYSFNIRYHSQWGGSHLGWGYILNVGDQVQVRFDSHSAVFASGRFLRIEKSEWSMFSSFKLKPWARIGGQPSL